MDYTDVEHINCIKCKKDMSYLAMIDTELYIGKNGFREKGHMFGDNGIHMYLFVENVAYILRSLKIYNFIMWLRGCPTRGWNRPSLRLGGKAHSVFDGACCILNLRVHSRLGGSTASRWAE